MLYKYKKKERERERAHSVLENSRNGRNESSDVIKFKTEN